MTTNYAPARPALRCALAAAALTATVASGAFIDVLAQKYPADAMQAAATQRVAAAANAR